MTAQGKHIVVVGAGGNIGSHLVPHLGRMPGIGRVTLVDFDTYEAKNLCSQDINPGDAGQPKAIVQARRLRRINPQLEVCALVERLENVPRGLLRADVILTGLDSRIARRHAQEIAWRLGVPLIDAGVEPGGWLARINVYLPGPNQPCLECGWDEKSYQLLEQEYPCAPGVPAVASTNGHSSLGALAAALLAIEGQKILEGRLRQAAVGRQVLIDAASHRHFVTAYRRNAHCRFDHQVWRIRRLTKTPAQLTLAEALALGSRGATLRLDNHPLVTRLSCPACGRTRPLFRLKGRFRPAERRCGNCGREMLATGAGMLDPVGAGDLSDETRSRSLARIGFRAGDVFTVRSGRREHHFELGEGATHE